MIKTNVDIAIVGGGAAGLACACTVGNKYKFQNKKIVILEKQPRVGKKLLATGNGKCNLTNLNATASDYYGSFNTGVQHLLTAYSPKKVINFFEDIGLVCTYDSKGRVYPLCKQASAVLDVLRAEIKRIDIEEKCDFNITKILKENDKFVIYSNDEVVFADKIVISCGGKASPKLGGNASGIDILKNFGHKTTASSPSLCPINVKNNILKSLKGIRVQGKVTLYSGKNQIKSEYGEIQFTEKALSGICVFNLSRYINKYTDSYVRVSLLPEYSMDDLLCMIQKRIKIFNNDLVENLFTGLFNKRIGQALLKTCGVLPFSRSVNTITQNEINSICHIINNWDFTVQGNNNFDNAQVTAGGIKGNEIDYKTMQSKKIKGLYICGEVIDVDGDCGGYNLQFAFSSGIAVGENL